MALSASIAVPSAQTPKPLLATVVAVPLPSQSSNHPHADTRKRQFVAKQSIGALHAFCCAYSTISAGQHVNHFYAAPAASCQQPAKAARCSKYNTVTPAAQLPWWPVAKHSAAVLLDTVPESFNDGCLSLPYLTTSLHPASHQPVRIVHSRRCRGRYLSKVIHQDIHNPKTVQLQGSTSAGITHDRSLEPTASSSRVHPTNKPWLCRQNQVDMPAPRTPARHAASPLNQTKLSKHRSTAFLIKPVKHKAASSVHEQAHSYGLHQQAGQLLVARSQPLPRTSRVSVSYERSMSWKPSRGCAAQQPRRQSRKKRAAEEIHKLQDPAGRLYVHPSAVSPPTPQLSGRPLLVMIQAVRSYTELVRVVATNSGRMQPAHLSEAFRQLVSCLSEPQTGIASKAHSDLYISGGIARQEDQQHYSQPSVQEQSATVGTIKRTAGHTVKMLPSDATVIAAFIQQLVGLCLPFLTSPSMSSRNLTTILSSFNKLQALLPSHRNQAMPSHKLWEVSSPLVAQAVQQLHDKLKKETNTPESIVKALHVLAHPSLQCFTNTSHAACLQQLHHQVLPYLRKDQLSISLNALSMLPSLKSEPWANAVCVVLLKCLPEFTQHDLVNILAACARLELQPPPAIVQAALHVKPADQSSAQVVTLLWACACLRTRPSTAWMSDCMSTMYENIDNLQPKQLSQVFWAMCKLGWLARTVWLEALLCTVLAQAPCFTPLDLCMMLDGLAAVHYRPPASWMSGLLSNAKAKLTTCEPNMLAQACFSLSKLGLIPRADFIEAMLLYALQCSKTMDTRSYCNLLWAIGHKDWLGHCSVQAGWLGDFLLGCKHRMGDFSPKELVRMLYSVSDMKHHQRPGKDWMRAFYAASVTCMHSQEPLGLVNLLLALQRLQACTPPAPWLNTWFHATARHMHGMDAVLLKRMAVALTYCKSIQPPAWWVHTLVSRVELLGAKLYGPTRTAVVNGVSALKHRVGYDAWLLSQQATPPNNLASNQLLLHAC